MNINNLITPKSLSDYMRKNIDYGYLTKSGKIEKENYDNMYKRYVLQTPLEVYKNKVGVCWDQVQFEIYIFDNFIKDIDAYKIFYICQNNEVYGTHTFIAYKCNTGIYYFENSYYKERGIKRFNTYKEVYEYVSNSMRKDNDDNGIKVYEISNYPKGGSTVMEFIKSCESQKLIANYK